MTTIVATSLPDLDLEEKSLLVVDSGDAAAPITRLVIHVRQDAPDELVSLDLPLRLPAAGS